MRRVAGALHLGGVADAAEVNDRVGRRRLHRARAVVARRQIAEDPADAGRPRSATFLEPSAGEERNLVVTLAQLRHAIPGKIARPTGNQDSHA